MPDLDLLLVADSPDGGLGLAAKAQAEHFVSLGWTVALAAPGMEVLPFDALPVSLPVPSTAFDVPKMLRTAVRLRRTLREQRPALVHTHGLRSQLLTLLAGRRSFVTVHGGGRIVGQTSLGTAVRQLSRRVAPELALIAFAAAPTPGRWQVTPIASPRLRTLPLFGGETMAEAPTFLWVGRMAPPKRPDIFVRAVLLAAQEGPVRGVMLGAGPLLDDVRGLIASTGAPVEVVGETDDVEAYLAQAWGVCLFSDFEGVPFAVEEAMWAGRPVIVTPLPALRGFAGTEASYATTPPEAAVAMRRLCDREVAVGAGHGAARRAREGLSVDAPFPALLAAYDDWRSGSRRAAGGRGA